MISLFKLVITPRVYGKIVIMFSFVLINFLSDGHFIGAPVVFVPGNGGSHKQVRSLGSVAQRMSDKYSTPFQLNYFTIDFNEVFIDLMRHSSLNFVNLKEYSAVNSFKLEDQTIFLKESVIRIIDLYKKRGRDVSLVLIGHSVVS